MQSFEDRYDVDADPFELPILVPTHERPVGK